MKLNPYWISGFIDGEGCFAAYARLGKGKKDQQRNYDLNISFELGLRLDDKKIVEKIKETLGCGYINIYPPTKKKLISHPNDKPQIRYTVRKIKDLALIIVPFFEKYPLQSKKARDFEIWKELVKFFYEKKHLQDWDYVVYLSKKLKSIRQYDSPIIPRLAPRKEKQLHLL